MCACFVAGRFPGAFEPELARCCCVMLRHARLSRRRCNNLGSCHELVRRRVRHIYNFGCSFSCRGLLVVPPQSPPKYIDLYLRLSTKLVSGGATQSWIARVCVSRPSCRDTIEPRALKHTPAKTVTQFLPCQQKNLLCMCCQRFAARCLDPLRPHFFAPV